MSEQLLIKAIYKLRPNAEFSFNNCDYSTIVWDKLDGEAPTQKEIADAIDVVISDITTEATDKGIAKSLLLERLGITEKEAALLLG